MAGKSTRSNEDKKRIVIRVISGSTPIAEICRRENVAFSEFYKFLMNSLNLRGT